MSNVKKRVIVVGAGISGLQAASVLIANGVDVIVLEAQDRIGGRILTNRNDTDCVDVGAAWMHGTSYNPLVRLISQLKIEYYYDDGSPLYFTEFGPAGPNFKATNVAEEFMDYLRYWLQKNPEGPDCSVEEHICRFVLQHELISNDEKLWAPEAMRIVENTLGLSLDQISSMFLNDMLPPSRDLYVKGGYDKVIDFVAQPIVQSSGALRRYHDVQRIDWDRSQDDTPVVVHALDRNTGTSLTIEGDAVIVTVPLGVLHLNKLQFQPPLPDNLVVGMSKMSYGALGKVIFHFSDVFWSKHNDTLIYFPTPGALADDSESHRYPVLSHCFVATNLWIMTGAKKLCILLSPPVVQHVEQMAGNQSALFSYFEPLLELFRTEPYRALPPLTSVETTSWTMNEYSGYGTYSTARVGDDPRMFWDALDANKSLRLQFAGEHCSRTATGCVHGAYESGEAAANNVLQILKILKK